MPTVEPFTVASAGGRTLHGAAHLPEGAGPRPAVVLCHGFKGFMEWGFHPYLAELLAGQGWTVVRFNFSGSGMRPGDERVTDPAAFRSATLTRDLDDLESVLPALGRSIAPGRVAADRVALVGHSRGGGVALLAAARHPDRIRSLVTWSAVSTFLRHGPEEREAWRRRGAAPVVNARTGQELEVGIEVLEDLEARRDELDLLAAAATRKAPWLIVHGEADESVPADEARQLDRHATPPKELLLIPGAGHTLGAVHPFAGADPSLTRAVEATRAWLRRWLE